MNNFLVKKDYLNELTPLSKEQISYGDKGDDVKRIQELLYLWQLDTNIDIDTIIIDGIWGDHTQKIVLALQPEFNVKADGIITNQLFLDMLAPMKEAFSLESFNKKSLRDKIVFFAKKHLQYRSCVINQLNQGPWVRSYMGGHDGEEWYWCQGFVCTILDQAFSTINQKFTDHYANTFICEKFHQGAKDNNLCFSYNDILNKKTSIEAGDIGLVISPTKNRATHVFIIVDVLDAEKQIVQTIEGNTNFGGSRNGTGVFMRIRSFSDTIELVKCITE